MVFAFLRGILSTILLLVARSDFFASFSRHFSDILSQDNVSVANTYTYYAGTLLAGVLLTFDYTRISKKSECLGRQLENFLEHYKALFLQTLSRELHRELPHINIRIFVYRKIKKEFKILNIDGLAVVGMTENLTFKTDPPQGLVGYCFVTRKIIYEPDLYHPKNEQPLSKDLKNRTSDLRFCLCVPIFNNKDNVVAVVAFDSSSALDLGPQVNDILTIFIAFSQNLQKAMPKLFKPRFL